MICFRKQQILKKMTLSQLHILNDINPLDNLSFYMPVDRKFYRFEKSTIADKKQIINTYCFENFFDYFIVKIQHGYGNLFLFNDAYFLSRLIADASDDHKLLVRSGFMYTVNQNDTLNHLAEFFYRNEYTWQDVYKWNKSVVGSDPTVIGNGMELMFYFLKDDISKVKYVVNFENETLQSIVTKLYPNTLKYSWRDVHKWNDKWLSSEWNNNTVIRIGSVLEVIYCEQTMSTKKYWIDSKPVASFDEFVPTKLFCTYENRTNETVKINNFPAYVSALSFSRFFIFKNKNKETEQQQTTCYNISNLVYDPEHPKDNYAANFLHFLNFMQDEEFTGINYLSSSTKDCMFGKINVCIDTKLNTSSFTNLLNQIHRQGHNIFFLIEKSSTSLAKLIEKEFGVKLADDKDYRVFNYGDNLICHNCEFRTKKVLDKFIMSAITSLDMEMFNKNTNDLFANLTGPGFFVQNSKTDLKNHFANLTRPGFFVQNSKTELKKIYIGKDFKKSFFLSVNVYFSKSEPKNNNEDAEVVLQINNHIFLSTKRQICIKDKIINLEYNTNWLMLTIIYDADSLTIYVNAKKIYEEKNYQDVDGTSFCHITQCKNWNNCFANIYLLDDCDHFCENDLEKMFSDFSQTLPIANTRLNTQQLTINETYSPPPTNTKQLMSPEKVFEEMTRIDDEMKIHYLIIDNTYSFFVEILRQIYIYDNILFLHITCWSRNIQNAKMEKTYVNLFRDNDWHTYQSSINRRYKSVFFEIFLTIVEELVVLAIPTDQIIKTLCGRSLLFNVESVASTDTCMEFGDDKNYKITNSFTSSFSAITTKFEFMTQVSHLRPSEFTKQVVVECGDEIDYTKTICSEQEVKFLNNDIVIPLHLSGLHLLLPSNEHDKKILVDKKNKLREHKQWHLLNIDLKVRQQNMQQQFKDKYPFQESDIETLIFSVLRLVAMYDYDLFMHVTRWRFNLLTRKEITLLVFEKNRWQEIKCKPTNIVTFENLINEIVIQYTQYFSEKKYSKLQIIHTMIGIIPVNKLPYKYNEHDYIKITHNEPPLPLVTSLALVRKMPGKIIIDLHTPTSWSEQLNFNQFFFYDSSKNVVNPDSCVVSSKWPGLPWMKYYNEAKYMSLGWPTIYSSSKEDRNPSVSFKFSDLSKVARIVFYNRSDNFNFQKRILAYNMRCIYDDEGSAKNNSVVFRFTSELIQTFTATTDFAPSRFIELGSGGTMFTYFGMKNSEHYLIPKITFSHGWSKIGENMSSFELDQHQIKTIKITEKHARMYRVSFAVAQENSVVHYFTTNDQNDFRVKTIHTLDRNYDTIFLPHIEKRTTNLYLKLFSKQKVNIDSVEIYYKND